MQLLVLTKVLLTGTMVIIVVCVPIYDVINFEIYLKFLIKLLYYVIKKVRRKMEISQKQKYVLKSDSYV